MYQHTVHKLNIDDRVRFINKIIVLSMCVRGHKCIPGERVKPLEIFCRVFRHQLSDKYTVYGYINVRPDLSHSASLSSGGTKNTHSNQLFNEITVG